MKTSFDWKELHKNQCPNMLCVGEQKMVLNEETKQYKCDLCGYVISQYKFEDITKGKQSSGYKRKQKAFIRTAESRSFSKKTYQEAILAQEKERAYNKRKIAQLGQ